MFNLKSALRTHLAKAIGYSSARNEFNEKAEIFLDANENPYDSGFNRYPDPLASQLCQVLAKEHDVASNQIAVANGSDEWIDLLFRLFVEPASQSVLQLEPTYGMYQVSAALNNVNCLSLPLNKHFDIDLKSSLAIIEEQNISLIFLCSPNNPTGNNLNPQSIESLLNNSQALVVVDEAYIHYSDQPSWTKRLNEFPNLIILQTFSKAIGLAGLRIGLLFASPQLIAIFHKFKAPYNVNVFSQEIATRTLSEVKWRQQCEESKTERALLAENLGQLDFVVKVYPSQANFILCIFKDATAVFKHLKQQGIIVRNRQKDVPQALRLSIGTPQQNKTLLKILAQYED